jgi:outer membrane lipoprotein-sorting protein
MAANSSLFLSERCDRVAGEVQMNQQSTDPSENKVSDDILQRAIASIEEEAVPVGPPPKLIAATLHALHESGQPPRRAVRLVSMTKTMKTMMTAASLLFIVGAATLLTLAINTPSSAFGQALRQLREARSMSYVELITVKDQRQPVRTRVFVAEDGRKRLEAPGIGKSGGVVTIFDAASKVRILLIENSKIALVHDQTTDERGEPVGPGFLVWLQTLKRLGDKPDKELGQKELEGKRVTGFVATQGNFTFTMWVDGATGEPVQIEYDSPVNGADLHVAMTDFRFNEKLDESLFSFAVPAGYKVQQQPTTPSVPGGETSVVEALRGYAKRAGGNYPSSLADWGSWAVLFSKGSSKGVIDPDATHVLAHLGAITPFLVSMPKDHYAYLGKGKTVDQKDAILFWYKRADGTYRAIYGDLSAKDIKAENLPK